MGKNLEYNKKIFEKLEKAPDKKSIFSRDGFIEYQNGMADVKYANVTAAYGGCGAIAVWNIMKFFNIATDKATLFDEMEKGVMFGGKLGTDTLFIKRYLNQKGFQIGMYCSLKEFNQTLFNAGILYYMKSNLRAHYVAFTPAGINEKGEHLYRFHNASAGSYWETFNGIKYIENIPMTMESFLNESKAKVKVFYDVRK